MDGTNPFLASLANMREGLLELSSGEKAIDLIDKLPDEPLDRLEAIRKVTPDQLTDRASDLEGFRVSARWFEKNRSGAGLRYVYVDGHPPGTPQPPVRPGKPPGGTICLSLGTPGQKALCLSVGD